MARKVPQLTDKEVEYAASIKLKKLKKEGYTGNAIERQFTIFDGGGLFLLILPDKIIIDENGKEKKIPGSKLWRFKYRLRNKEKLLALGSYPELSLEDVREKRTYLRKKVENGIDPAEEKKISKAVAGKTYAAPDSFENIARSWHNKPKKKPWSSAYSEVVLSRLVTNVFKKIGHIPISGIEPEDLEKILEEIEARDALVLAHKVKGYLTQICRYAVKKRYIKHSPAGELLDGVLSPIQTTNYPALTKPADIALFLNNIRDPNFIKCRVQTQALLQLYPMLFTRPSELRLLEWSEIDYEEKRLDIPAEKMKMKKAHFVPLSRLACDIIESLKGRAGTSRYVFASKKNSPKPICARTASIGLVRMGFKDEITPHGWRATARTVARERLHTDLEYLEIQLAHKTMSPNGTAYDRVAFMHERQQFMQAWSDYLDDLKMGRKPQNCWTKYVPPEEDGDN